MREVIVEAELNWTMNVWSLAGSVPSKGQGLRLSLKSRLLDVECF